MMNTHVYALCDKERRKYVEETCKRLLDRLPIGVELEGMGRQMWNAAWEKAIELYPLIVGFNIQEDEAEK